MILRLFAKLFVLHMTLSLQLIFLVLDTNENGDKRINEAWIILLFIIKFEVLAEFVRSFCI